MKIINQHNLEEWLFDYFEGNLNESDKSILIDYVEKNPGAEKEFGYWKTSFQTLSEPTISITDFQNSLIKQTWFGKYKYYVLASTSILFLGLITLFYTPSEIEPNTKKTNNNKFENQIVTPKVEVTVSQKQSIKKRNLVKQFSQKPDSIMNENAVIEEREMHTIEPIHSLKTVEIEPNITFPVTHKEINLDSFSPTNTITQPVLPKKKPKKRKISGYNNEPVNDNF